MPIDPTGTTPEPVTQAEQVVKVNLKCKNSSCSSMQAEEMKIPGHTTASGKHMYRCLKCNSTWTISVGGTFEY